MPFGVLFEGRGGGGGGETDAFWCVVCRSENLERYGVHAIIISFTCFTGILIAKQVCVYIGM